MKGVQLCLAWCQGQVCAGSVAALESDRVSDFVISPLTIHIAVWDRNINDGVCVFKADILFFFRKWENNVWRITRKSLGDVPY